MIPYVRHQITEDDREAVMAVLSHGENLTQGEFVKELERRLCEESGAARAVVVSSGTAALHLAYLATRQIKYTNVRPLINIPTITFMATANSAYHCNMNVHFVDCDPNTGMGQFTEDMTFIVPVWLGGRYCPLPEEIENTATIIIDAAQGMGAPLLRLAMRYATAICVSFHATKQVAAGEGGAILTNDEELARKCAALRDHGREEGYMPVDIGPGFNYRMDEMSAALACSQLDRLPRTLDERTRLASIYITELGDKIQCLCGGAMHLFQVQVGDWTQRNHIIKKCTNSEIETQLHYFPVHLQPWWDNQQTNSLWGGVTFCDTTISIPFYPGLTEDDQAKVIETIKGAL